MTATFPYLAVLIAVPAVGAGVVALIPREKVVPWFHEALGVAVAVITLGVAAAVAVSFNSGVGGYQMVSTHTWASDLGIQWAVGIDGISLFLVLLTAVLFPLAMLGARVRRDSKGFIAWLLLLEAGCMGSFVSLDLILFFLFFELTLVPTYFLIGGWGFAQRGYAAIKFFVYTFAGSAFLLVGIVAIAFIHRGQTGVLTFDLQQLMHTHVSGTEGVLLFCAFTIAFAIKAPIFPFHTWLPNTHSDSPVAVAILMIGIMAKIGTYGIIRFDLNLFPQASRTMAPVLLTLAVIGIVYGAMVAGVQKNLKVLLAYSSLASMGFVVLGTFALNPQGLAGGVLQMANHGLISTALFLLVGWVYRRRATWQTSSLKGLQWSAPVLAGCFTVAMLASIGVPGLNGFVGEFLILLGTFVAHRWWAVAATAGVIAAAVYLLWAYQQVFHGEPTEEDVASTPDLRWPERLVVAPIIVLIVALGIFPKPVLDRITPSVNRVVVRVDTVTRTPLSAELRRAQAADEAATAAATTPATALARAEARNSSASSAVGASHRIPGGGR